MQGDRVRRMPQDVPCVVGLVVSSDRWIERRFSGSNETTFGGHPQHAGSDQSAEDLLARLLINSTVAVHGHDGLGFPQRLLSLTGIDPGRSGSCPVEPRCPAQAASGREVFAW